MNGFVATPPAPQSPAQAVVEADGWFPAIDVNAMRDAMRLKGDVPHPRLVAAIEGGILTVLGDLAIWKATHVDAGKEGLEEVEPEKTIGGRPRLVLLFERAVRFAAAAELADLARDNSATADATPRIEDEPLVAEDMRRISLNAVRDILGVGRVDVELI